MQISITGLANLYSCVILIYLAYKTYLIWQKERTFFVKLFFWFVVFMSLFLLSDAIRGIFFVINPFLITNLSPLGTFLQVIGLAFAGSSVVYLKLPRISPIVSFLGFLSLGLISVALEIIFPNKPFSEPSGSISWNPHLFPSVYKFLLFMLTILPLGVIFVKESFVAESPLIRLRALGMGINIFIMVFFTSVMAFFLDKFLNFGALSRDLSIIAMGTLIFLTIILTQKTNA